jgi:hypothetical protein
VGNPRHAEVLVACALHDQRLQHPDRTNLPYADMAGFEATVPGVDAWLRCGACAGTGPPTGRT